MANYQESTSSSGTLPFYNTNVQDLLEKGLQTLNQSNWMSQSGAPQQQVAGFSGLQNQAFNMIPGITGAWQPTVQGGLNAISSAQQSAQFNPNQLQQFMNPYLSGVVNEIARVGNQNLNENILPGIQDLYGGLGQYGSARQALATGTAAAQAQKDILGQQTNALNTGFNQAMQNYGNFAQLGAQTGLQAGQNLGNLAGTQSQLGLADYGTTYSAGQAQQQQQQAQLNAQYQNQLANQNRPWDMLNQWAGLFKVNTPQSSNTSSWSTQMKEGGLVKLAKGGLSRNGTPEDWEDLRITDREQLLRDQLRRVLLSREMGQYPEDSDKLTELINRIPDLTSDLTGGLSSSLPLLAAGPGNGGVLDINPGSSSSDRMQMARDLLRRRDDFNTRVQQSLAPLEEPTTLDKINRALFEADAMGPANYGQILGRIGNQYYSQEDARQKENRAREQARLALEERGLPKITSSGLTGGVEHYKTMKGKDGSVWAFSDIDPNKKILIQRGGYSAEVAKAAAQAADNDLKDAIFESADQRAEARRRLIDHYSRVLAPMFGDNGNEDLSSEEGEGTSKSPSMVSPKPNLPGRVAPPAMPSSTMPPGSAASPKPGTIPTSQETKEAETVGAGQGKDFTDLQREARESRVALNNYERLGQLLDQVHTGKLTPAGTEISAWMKSVGTIPGMGPIKDWLPDFETLPNKEAARALMGQMALQMRNPSGGAGMPGAMSDKDREFLISMTPSLSNTPEGVKLMIDTQKKLAERAQDVARLAREYRVKNPRSRFDEGFYDYLTDWAGKHPLFEVEKPKAKRSVDEILKQYRKGD